VTAFGAAESSWDALAAAQQPRWGAHPAYHRARRTLSAAAPLVSMAELRGIRREIAAVAAGEARLLQLGDCAESFFECTPHHTDEKLGTLDRIAGEWERVGGRDVVRIGRIGGQFAKPRSATTERHGDRELPAFRGHLVNSEVPTPSARQHDPRRMLWAYEASAKVLAQVGAHRRASGGRGPWSSHEALVLDYEEPLLRTDPVTGKTYLASTHFPWIGVRTHQPDLAHVRMLATVANPVGCKVGPATDHETVLRLCEILDPDREPGRLVLIARMGARLVADALPGIVRAVRDAGHPVVWLSDPMHGNTVTTPSGHKTRHLSDIVAEVTAFRSVVTEAGLYPGGLHLEVAASDVTECVGGPVRDEHEVPSRYTSLCDPRLNLEQAMEVVTRWV
jgi:3-deoxy-7-phosphoheptulonate synthase